MFLCLLLFLSSAVYAQEFQITIDAEKDAFYNTLSGPIDGWLWIPHQAYNANGPMPEDDLDCSANWYSAWDDTYMYVYVEVNDDIINQNQGTNYWANDCFDAKIDPDINVPYNAGVFCFTMTCMDSADVDQSYWGGVANLVEPIGGGWADSTKRPVREDYARKLMDYSYVLECRLKWDFVATGPTDPKGPIVPAVGNRYGFAVSIHDNDYFNRTHTIQWAAVLNDNVYNNCSNHGYIELLDGHKIKYVARNLRDTTHINVHDGMYQPGGSGISQESDVVNKFDLLQNYPNPFNPSTTISYTVQKPSRVKMCVYDLLGNEVAMLVDGSKQAGTYTVQFDGSDLSSGIYVYKLQLEDKVITKKMTLIK